MGHLNMEVNIVIVLFLCANAALSFSLNRDVFNNYRFRREVAAQTAEVNASETSQGNKVADVQEIGTGPEKGVLESTHLSDSHMGKPLTATESQHEISTWNPHNYFDHHRGGEQSKQSDYHGNQYDSGHTSDVTPDPDLQHEATQDPDLQHEPTPDPDLQHEPTPDPDLHQEVTPDPDMAGSDHSYGYHNPLFMTRPGESAPIALPQISPEHGQHQNNEQQSRNQHSGEVGNSGQQDGNHPVNYQEHFSEGHKMPQALALTGPKETHGEQAPIERDAPVALAQKANAQRPRPDWSQGTGTNKQTAHTGSPSGTTQAPNMFNNMVAMRAMGGGDMMQKMMKMQMYQNPQYMKQYQAMYRQMFPNLFPGGSETGSGGESGSQGQMPMGAMYAMGGEDGFMNPMGGDINMQSLYMAQQCQKTPDAPMCKMSQWGMPMGMNMGVNMGMGPMGMMGETQIEGPMGEMDIEPMEMDIEGPMAYQLLKKLNMGPKNVHPHHQEITLNQHVFRALRTRFGVNTTAAIQAKSSDPKLSAFLFQVLEASNQVAPGEYHANLSQAQVNKILANLDHAATGNNRMPPNNLDHAMIAKDSSNRPVLTLDNPSQPNTPFGALPLAAQPGTFQALVQTAMGITTKAPGGEIGEGAGVGGEGAEAAEAPEKKTATKPAENEPPAQQNNGTVNTNAQTATTKQHTPTPTRGTIQTGQTAMVGTPGVAAGSTVAGTPIGSQGNNLNTFGTPTQQFGAFNGNTAATGEKKKGKGQEIRNKDGIPGLSKDARNKAFGKMDKANTNMMPIQPATQLPNQIVTDQQSLGMQEAGIFPGSNGTVPIKKAETGYTTSTAFAIAAIVLIVLMIIIGPILCMLCKMREKRQERSRKLRALKNREVSENNIMEAMMLHEFGVTGKNSFSNEGATGGNYYKNEQTRYDTIDPEIECLNQSHPLP